jgi:hypothetical protein
MGHTCAGGSRLAYFLLVRADDEKTGQAGGRLMCNRRAATWVWVGYHGKFAKNRSAIALNILTCFDLQTITPQQVDVL